MLTAGPRGQFPRWRRNRKRLRFEASRSVFTVQCTVGKRPCTKLTPYCNHRSGHLKTESFPIATPSWKLAPRPRSKYEKRTTGSAWETWDSCRCWRCALYSCKVRNKFLVNFWNRAILLCIPCIKYFISSYSDILSLLIKMTEGSVQYRIDFHRTQQWTSEFFIIRNFLTAWISNF